MGVGHSSTQCVRWLHVSKKILIVEDESDIRAVLVAWLEAEEFEVTEASNGIEGLAEFERVHPDLALLDLKLPGMSGLELCRNIRQVSRIPLVMFSAVDDAEKVQEAIAHGATDFVLKNTGFDELMRRISQHLSVERVNISKDELEDAYPARLIKAPDTQSSGVGRTLEVGATDGPVAPETPSADDLWTWAGEYFGFRDGQNLWTLKGRHVGRFRRDEVFRSNGLYVGDLVQGRLVVDWHKTARRASSFTPSEDRGGCKRYSDREPFDMMIGFKDFPDSDQI